MGKKALRLLEAGYFPSQLPPAFTTVDFSKESARLLRKWAAAGVTATTLKSSFKAEPFSIARTGHRRRVLSISNPIVQALLSYEIERHWSRIRKHLVKSKLSVSRAGIDFKGATALRPVPLHEIYAKKLSASGGYRFLLRTDVSRFYPTVYTHSIPWAVHSKPAAKANRTKLSPTWYGNILDKIIRAGQDQQTMGIPIGSDTSRIVAELLAVAVDLNLKQRLKKWPAGFRYVDDYYLFFEDKVEAENALAQLSVALREYELQLNFEKTHILSVHRISEDSWTHYLRNTQFPSDVYGQRSAVNRYFDHALDLAEAHSIESVMRYALRRISSTVIRKENWEYFEAHLCRVAFAHPNTIQDITEILATYGRYGYPLNRERISRVCRGTIEYAAPLGHHSEVVWALWLCIELSIKLNRAATRALGELASAVCTLLALELERLGLLTGKIDRRAISKAQCKEALYGDSWLLSYELAKHGYAGSTNAHVMADTLFGELLNRKVTFFVPTNRLKPIFRIKESAKTEFNLESENDFFDSDIEFDEFVDFEDPISEYHEIGEIVQHKADLEDDFPTL